MSLKRALVVDDSRSARAFLTRILERHELQVDSAESAEQAIDYLTRQRPDVIFMDHLMPGMDGFQAVQAIKNDPRTSSIPILMYTSQEGELYLSQARALGAAGIIPKQTRSADVSRVLEQLDLLQPASAHSELITLPAAPSDEATALPAPPAEEPSRPAPAPAMATQAPPGMPAQDWRRVLDAALESQAERILGDVRLMFQELPGANRPVPVPRGRRWPLALAALALAALALLGALALGLLWQRALQGERGLAAQLAGSQTQLAAAAEHAKALEAQNAALAAAAAETAAPLADNGSVSISVPFGEAPLAQSRVARVQSILERLQTQGFHGSVQVRSIPGRFCLVGGDAALLAAADTAYAKCGAFAAPLSAAAAGERVAPAFTAMIATFKQHSAGAIGVQLSDGAPEETVSDYPQVTDALTAGDWNKAAAANNRVEIRWHAQPKT